MFDILKSYKAYFKVFWSTTNIRPLVITFRALINSFLISIIIVLPVSLSPPGAALHRYILYYNIINVIEVGCCGCRGWRRLWVQRRLYGRGGGGGGGVDSVSSWSSHIASVVVLVAAMHGKILLLYTRINDDDNNDSNIIMYVWPRRKRR